MGVVLSCLATVDGKEHFLHVKIIIRFGSVAYNSFYYYICLLFFSKFSSPVFITRIGLGLCSK